MGERLGGGEGGSSWGAPRETDPNAEMQKHHDAILALLGRLIECSGSLSSAVKKQLGQKIQVHLGVLGLTDLSQLGQISKKLFDAGNNPPIPEGYPQWREFQGRFREVTMNPVTLEGLPGVPRSPGASDIARYGTTDWGKVTDRRGQGSLVDYTYFLGILMSSEFTYNMVFPQSDALQIRSKWQVENGRHRALVLRTLGSDYVTKSGMNRWVKAERVR